MDGNNKESFYTILNGHAGDKSDRSKSDDLEHKEKTSDFAEDRRFHPEIRGVVSETISKSNSTNSSCAEHDYNKQQTFLNEDFKKESICAASIFRDRLPENNTPEGHVTYIKDVKDTGAVPKQKNKCMSFSDLKELIEKSADEILFIILNKESGFVRLLEEKLERDNMAYVLSLLGKAVSSAMNKNVIEMMNIVTSNSSFFLIKVQQYLSSFKQADSHDIHLDSILNLIIFLQKFQISLPSNACDVLLILLPLLKQISENYLIHDKRFCSESSAMIREIEESNNSILFKYSPNQMKQISKNEKLQLLDPPENYRTIPILPNELDIQQSFAFLRPSVIKGRYQDTEHYLDVQYRLLREDYVRPLRDGITEYLVFKKQNKSTKRIKDARVYPEVKLLKQEFVNGELLHMAFFNDKKFAKIKWEFSKRLLGKSLLCLSADEFKTMFFATIAQRDPKQLVKGFLMLRFEELTDEILNLQSSTNFVVIETDAYFESYRYNLDALLKLNESTFPMKRYIIETQKVVQKPQYLTDATTYDMRPLLLPINRASRMKMIDKFGTYCDYIYPANIPKRMENVPVLDSDSWPTCGELNLDSSQYSALKAAVTKEFAVIQGPPGTGKTYIGLRIAQLLLHNVHKWRSRANPSPILVLCYTNHALDQFLEGIINFTDQIVRIGSRGTNEAVSGFQINNLKRSNKIRTEMSNRIGDEMQELRKKKKSVDEAKSFLANSFSSILNENILQECMTPYQYSSLRNKKNSFNYIPMYHWLMNIQINYKQAHAFLPKYGPLWNEAPPVVESSDEDSEEAADIEYIEAQRDINSAEYEGVSYDLPLYKDEINAIFGLEDGWQLVGGKDGLKYYVNRCLIETRAMHKREANNIRDVWVLNYKQRWRLYKLWLESFIDKVNKHIPKLHQEIREGYGHLQKMRVVEDISVCRRALVVGMTITGAAKHRHIVQALNPNIVIVEEAAEVLESHIVTSLAPGTEHLILIGDHQQLKPSPTVHELATKFGMNVSLFERMVENGLDCYKLEIQHRMRPEIASLLVPHIYTTLLNHESVKKYENIKGVEKNLFFVNHSYYELQEKDSTSKVNVHEANFLLKFCMYLIFQGYEPSQITVLTTYSGQFFEMKKSPLKKILQDVKFTVVDNYQGEENDIILISFVRSNEEGQIGFLKISNRICVALSRAKKGLYCIGNFCLLAEKSKLWKNIIETLEGEKAIGPSLLLMCQNHPGVSHAVTTESDFDLVPDGGCTRPCEFRLPCGHACSLKCHPFDSEHKDIRCPKPCTKQCSKGHLCNSKCSEKCPPCTFEISKTVEKCGHVIKVPCYCEYKKIICTHPCEESFPCGHGCRAKCGESCSIECNEMVEVQSKVCGHNLRIKCSKSEDIASLLKSCKEACGVKLPCGHICTGTCSNCFQGRFHVACRKACERTLTCGHTCKSVCHLSCPPCVEKCENWCSHGKCNKECCDPCEKCTEPCGWICPHKSCTRLCWEPCNRTACEEPCPKTLKCEHPCIGICGEPCPAECRICDEEKMKSLHFGLEAEDGVKFVLLEDCNHVFEVHRLQEWMTQDILCERRIHFKVCPECNTVIRRNVHFEKVVKFYLEDIEKVNEIVSGSKKRNRELLDRIRFGKLSFSFFSSFWYSLESYLDFENGMSYRKLTAVENFINIFSFSNDVQDLDESSLYFFPEKLIKMFDYFKNIFKNQLTAFLDDMYFKVSEDQMKDVVWEIHRIKLLDELEKFLIKIITKKHVSIYKDNKAYFKKLIGYVTTYKPFRNEELKKFISDYQIVYKLFNGGKVNASDLEKQPVLKGMGLSRDNWYRCPNGHVWSFIQYGNAAIENKCLQCEEQVKPPSCTTT